MIASRIPRCLAMVAFAFGCGPGVAEGPVTDVGRDGGRTGDTGTEDGIDTRTAPPHDTGTTDTGTTDTEGADAGADTGDGCGEEIFEDAVVFESNGLQPGARFVDMSSECLLLRQETIDGVRTTVVFTDPWEPGHIGATAEWTSPLEPVALTCHPENWEAAVLFRTAAGNVLYQMDGYGGDPALLAGEATFGGRSLTGIRRFMRTANGGVNRICAFGQGIFCADSAAGWTAWTETLPHVAGRYINDMGLLSIADAWSLVAVGSGGMILVEGAGGWQPVDSGTAEELLAVGTMGDTFTAAGRNGIFVHGTVDGPRRYTFFSEDVVSLYWWSDQFLKGVTAAGTVFEGTIRGGELSLCLTSVTLDEPVFTSVLLVCGDAENYLIMTDSLVLGAYDCAPMVIV